MPTSFHFRQSGALRRQAQAPPDFVYQVRKRQIEYALPRIKHDVDRTAAAVKRKPHRFPHTPLNPIPIYRATQDFADGQSHTRCSYGRSVTPQEENGHISRELPASGLVHALKVRVLQQAP